MTLREALSNQGLSIEDIESSIQIMVDYVNNGANPEDVLEEYGLEPDYVMDLLEECI